MISRPSAGRTVVERGYQRPLSCPNYEPRLGEVGQTADVVDVGVEADIYHGSTEHAIYDAIATIQIPVTVVRGHPYQINPAEDLTASPTAPDLAASFQRGRDIQLVEHSHFIPMEDSALVARLIAEL